MPYIWRPGEVWRKYLKSADVAYDEASFQLGAMYVTLEMLSHMKMLEERAVVSEWGRQEAVSTLHTLLLQLNLADETYAMYDRLIRWRQPRFVAEHARGPEDTVVADGDETQVLVASSPDGEPVPWPSRLGSPGEWPAGHQSPDDETWPTRGE